MKPTAAGVAIIKPYYEEVSVDSSTKLKTIAAHLFAQRTSAAPQSDLPPQLALTSTEDSLAVQQLMIALNKGQVFGWKCLLPLDNGAIILAPILKPPQSFAQICTLYTEQNKARIEPEIAFVFAQNMPKQASYSEAEIDHAVSDTHMALELIQNRFSTAYQANHFAKLADGLSNQGVLLGPKINKQAAYDAAHITIAITQNNRCHSYLGKHPCGLAQTPIYWAVNYLAKCGITLAAGQILITGSYCGVIELDTDVDTEIDYAGLGKYTVKFSGLTDNDAVIF
ncbi:2-keto-4-pentenoate hydratase [Pseudoalteromonas sp. SR44-8]|nr:2-keto-4-pentenoate hydratase [Pseudoalteromonas sp. SR44-8]MBB1481464.1 2-keto-4-pentenoate hydratase [Pseudoalteromonas sp. SG41-2]